MKKTIIISLFLLLFSTYSVKAKQQKEYTRNGHEYVDLGLPSGTLWATCNVGAEQPEDEGYYFSWGDTQSHATKPSRKQSKYSNLEKKQISKYCTDMKFGQEDGKTELDAEDDAATVNWGKEWQTPSTDQIKELRDTVCCTWKWVDSYHGKNVCGFVVTSKINGKTLFFRGETYCWSRSPKEFCADILDLSKAAWDKQISHQRNPRNFIGGHDRGSFLHVRAVRKQPQDKILPALINKMMKYPTEQSVLKGVTQREHQYVDLGLPSGTLWATENIGADCATDDGVDICWGDKYSSTQGNIRPGRFNIGTVFFKGLLKHYSFYSKYVTSAEYGNIDNLTELEPEDDAATAQWGGKWRTPSYQQLKELADTTNCTWTWVTSYKGQTAEGYVIKSLRNNNEIFLPKPKQKKGDEIYISKTLRRSYNRYVYGITLNEKHNNITSLVSREHACKVRPVWQK